jgi:hypothetical protein
MKNDFHVKKLENSIKVVIFEPMPFYIKLTLISINLIEKATCNLRKHFCFFCIYSLYVKKIK